MNLRTTVMTAALTLGASTCGGSCTNIQIESADSGTVGSYVFEPSCDSLTVTVRNFEDNTRFFVYTDGAPPYHLGMNEPTHTFPLHISDYGLTIVHPDGTQSDSQMFHNPCE